MRRSRSPPTRAKLPSVSGGCLVREGVRVLGWEANGKPGHERSTIDETVILRSCLWPEGKTLESVGRYSVLYLLSSLKGFSALANKLTKPACLSERAPGAWILA